MSITVTDLTHIYSPGQPQEQVALDHISFRIEDGSFVGIIGHTGSGKSTLVQHLNGLLKPTSGTILLGDTDITKAGASSRQARLKTGLVFQYPEYQLFEETVAKDVAFGPNNLGLSAEETDARVRESLHLVGLDYEELKNVSPFELSGGQKRRVAIAGVIAMKPEILILDEPTAGLNPKAHRDILDMVRRIHEAAGNITLMVSHNMNDIARMCDQVLVIDHGRLLMNGSPGEVFRRGDELLRVGLGLPDCMVLARKIADAGLPLEGSFLTMEETADAIAAALQNK
ncbi:MAG: energy-coupling factor transporter ATPase [Firmicutes bacterium]|nr:energy-coupling factor transporter ATPase [Bacillota bacterium]